MSIMRILALVSVLICGAATGTADSPSPKPQVDHWAFAQLRRPSVPQVQRTDWVRSEIDTFILARLEQAGLGTARHCCGGRTTTWLDCHRRGKTSRRSWLKNHRRHSRKSWIVYSSLPITEKSGGGTGWTWSVMRRRTATSETTPSRTCGVIATMLSGR